MLTPLICAKYAWLRLAPAAGCYNKVNLYSLKRHFMCQITQGGSGRCSGFSRRGGRGGGRQGERDVGVPAAAHRALAPAVSSLERGMRDVMI